MRDIIYIIYQEREMQGDVGDVGDLKRFAKRLLMNEYQKLRKISELGSYSNTICLHTDGVCELIYSVTIRG